MKTPSGAGTTQGVLVMENLRTLVWGRKWEWVTLMFDLVGVGRYLHLQGYLVYKMMPSYSSLVVG